MANNCFHSLYIEGNNQDLIKAFQSLQELCQKTKEGQLLPFLDPKEDLYMFDIYVHDEHGISYWCKWSGNSSSIKKVMEFYGVTNYELEFEESMNGVYGKSGMKDGVYYQADLTESEMSRVNEDEDVPTLDGKPIESASEAYDDMLDELCKEKYPELFNK